MFQSPIQCPTHHTLTATPHLTDILFGLCVQDVEPALKQMIDKRNEKVYDDVMDQLEGIMQK